MYSYWKKSCNELENWESFLSTLYFVINRQNSLSVTCFTEADKIADVFIFSGVFFFHAQGLSLLQDSRPYDFLIIFKCNLQLMPVQLFYFYSTYRYVLILDQLI